MTSQPTTNVSVHPSVTANLAPRVVECRFDHRVMAPYYELSLSNVTFFISPAQLTTIADALAQYQTPTRSFGEQAYDAALEQAA